MTKFRCYSMALFVILALAISLAPRPVRAERRGENEERPIRLYASARFGPIGMISENLSALGAVKIDGRVRQGEQLIWGGELIEAPRDRSIRVSFDSVAEATLAQGTRVRFATSVAEYGGAGRAVLVATLLDGGLKIKLEPEAGAYLEAGGSRFTASTGARFRVAVAEGRAALDTISGVVQTQDPQTAGRRFILRPPAGLGGSISAASRSTRQIQIQVTDENDRPVPDLPVLFSLGSPCLGALGLGAAAGAAFKEKTDNRGIAVVTFAAGLARCSGSITATVEGSNASYTFQVKVQPRSFWTLRNSLLVGAAAAAGVGTGIAVSNSGGSESQPVTPVPPPVVRP